MTKLVSITLGDTIWLGVRFRGELLLLHPQARVGQRYRPGQRLRERP